MSYVPRTVHEVRCDAPTCKAMLEDADGAQFQSDTPGLNEFDKDMLETCMELVDWEKAGGLHYCETHAPQYRVPVPREGGKDL